MTLSAVVWACLQYFELPRALQSWKPRTLQLPDLCSCNMKAVDSRFEPDISSGVRIACLPITRLVQASHPERRIGGNVR